jgi:hypothetical protein
MNTEVNSECKPFARFAICLCLSILAAAAIAVGMS